MTGLGLGLQIGKWIIQAGAVMSALKAADPPDANYRAIARPVDPAIPRVRTGRRRLDAALHRLIRAGLDTARYGRATLTAVERMQGAMAAGERGWAARQIGGRRATRARRPPRFAGSRAACRGWVARCLEPLASALRELRHAGWLRGRTLG
jgi:hypothetical protein